MTDPSIAAFSLAEQVASYDADMALMHPNRARIIQLALELLPFAPESPILAVDLGAGTGVFTHAFLDRYPRSTVIAVDGSNAMADLAKQRLGTRQERVEFMIGNFRSLRELLNGRKGQLVFSSFALHHLNRLDKLEVVRAALDFLEPGGWFLNADLVIAESPLIEARLQEIRVAGIVRRAAGRDPRFATMESARKFLDDMEARHHDQPLTLDEDLEVLKDAGLAHPAVFWTEHREALMGGIKE